MEIGFLKERLVRELENFKELEERLTDPLLASNPAELKDVTRLHARLAPRSHVIQNYLTMIHELEESHEILRSEDKEMIPVAKEEIKRINDQLEKDRKDIESLLIPPDPLAGKNLIIEIRAGTGGEEAALFVSDLYRMYLRFIERAPLSCFKTQLKVELIFSSATEIGGYKEVTFSVSGDNAWTLFHQEGGAHRVQRIPVTESGGRIHTSAVTVAVMPEAEEEEVVIDEKDLRIDLFRASGAGGQHVNKTESAVRMTHIPSGIVVQCQDERSQLKNRNKAMRVLRTRLAEHIHDEQHAQNAALKKEQVKTGDRSERIRTYNFPQGRVSDHRIGYTAYNLLTLMDGDMDDLLQALIHAEREQKIKQIEKS